MTLTPTRSSSPPTARTRNNNANDAQRRDSTGSILYYADHQPPSPTDYMRSRIRRVARLRLSGRLRLNLHPTTQRYSHAQPAETDGDGDGDSISIIERDMDDQLSPLDRLQSRFSDTSVSDLGNDDNDDDDDDGGGDDDDDDDNVNDKDDGNENGIDDRGDAISTCGDLVDMDAHRTSPHRKSGWSSMPDMALLRRLRRLSHRYSISTSGATGGARTGADAVL
ncbi:uncharacterized protein EHS24_001351 [Apiotrichum porosum]|uniref:Uncharacterized protein n=1 Tax=Apiotrichum porosum TaxID=105984 RepID=A0A427XK94_9TREE|nr:uncharacterized protein EHS24_001351 [Apiotrichum porosum]RSH79311.1 hypothetical protein EHS24_001351 [Apiotrichum porosum]